MKIPKYEPKKPVIAPPLPRYGTNPPPRDIKFKFDKDSTKDFGGMIVERKPGYGKYGKGRIQPAGSPNNNGSRAGGARKKGGNVGIPERGIKKPSNRSARPARTRRVIP